VSREDGHLRTMGVAVSLMGVGHGQSENTVTPLASSRATSRQRTIVDWSRTWSPAPSPSFLSSGRMSLRLVLLWRLRKISLVSPLNALMSMIELSLQLPIRWRSSQLSCDDLRVERG